ncbi:hypothetical protein [Streptomyces sp. NPDC059651]|uniref:hypothetical protein n=1 Tax=Streptomyces sp. NPDC059651 TaxID=3346897 RepID=UPI00369C042B
MGIGTALTVGLLVITACSSSGHSADSAKENSIHPASDEVKIRTLPIEDYLPSSAEYVKITKARVQLDEQCMRDFGFTGFEALSVPQADPRDTFTADRYGIEDAAEAAKYGYHPSPALVAFAKAAPDAELPDDQELVMTGLPAGQSDAAALKAAPKSFKGVAIPAGGCIGQSTRQLTGGSDELYPDLPQDINGQSYLKAKEAPGVRAVFAAWSTCMAGKGFTYSDPMQANDDPAFGSSRTATAAEIATATADVACKDSTQLVDTWFRAEADIQASLIEDRHAELAPMKETRLTALGNASTVLAAG